MKYLFLFLLFFSSCIQANTKQYPRRVRADDYNFSVHYTKVVSHMTYGYDHGNILTIYFVDGTQMVVYANKYCLDIYE